MSSPAAHHHPRRMRLCSRLVVLALAVLSGSTAAHTQPPPVANEREVDVASYTGVIQETYPDGRPKVWKQLINGQANGLWLEWYPDGTVRFRAYWRDGKGDGKWQYFHPNGALRFEGTYAADRAIGIARDYFPNGVLRTETTYVNGEPHGEVYIYDATGNPTETRRYEYGTRVYEKPTLFAPGVIASPTDSEWDITFVPAGDTAYFTRREVGGVQKIYQATRTDDGWSTPAVAPFSTSTDEGPFITPDGQRFYFASTRPRPGMAASAGLDMNIWFMDRTATGWSTPQPLPPIINGTVGANDRWPANYEASPATDSAGNLYFWTRRPGGTDADIFLARRREDGTFATPSSLGEPPNHRGFDSGAKLSPDGQYLVFASSDRSDAFGGEDLYVSRRIGDGWSVPTSLGPDINTSAQESAPNFSPDGRYFYFSSNRVTNGSPSDDSPWNIYFLETRFLQLP